MRTDGNPRLLEVRQAFHTYPRRWPRLVRVAVIFLASGACWAAILGVALVIGALAHG